MKSCLFLSVILIFLTAPALAERNYLPGSWTVLLSDEVESRVLHPDCFTYEWMSSDNFEEFEEVFQIKQNDFRRFPGKAFGTEITNYHPIQPSWNKNGFVSHETISLIQPVEKCAPRLFQVTDTDTGVYVQNSTEFGQIEQMYEVLKRVSYSHCSALAPDIGAPCIEAFEIKVGEYSGGSMGWDIRRGTYGLFDLHELGLSVVPLAYH